MNFARPNFIPCSFLTGLAAVVQAAEQRVGRRVQRKAVVAVSLIYFCLGNVHTGTADSRGGQHSVCAKSLRDGLEVREVLSDRAVDCPSCCGHETVRSIGCNGDVGRGIHVHSVGKTCEDAVHQRAKPFDRGAPHFVFFVGVRRKTICCIPGVIGVASGSFDGGASRCKSHRRPAGSAVVRVINATASSSGVSVAVVEVEVRPRTHIQVAVACHGHRANDQVGERLHLGPVVAAVVRPPKAS